MRILLADRLSQLEPCEVTTLRSKQVALTMAGYTLKLNETLDAILGYEAPPSGQHWHQAKAALAGAPVRSAAQLLADMWLMAEQGSGRCELKTELTGPEGTINLRTEDLLHAPDPRAVLHRVAQATGLVTPPPNSR